MANFTKDETHRMDWQLIENSSVTKFFRREILDNSVSWLKTHDYKIIELDFSSYSSAEIFLVALANQLNLSELFQGRSLDAFDDLIYNLEIPSEGGLAIIVHQYDLLFKAEPEKGWRILNILDRHSRRNMLFGLRLLTLIQSTDPALFIDDIGAQPVEWNPSEWSDYQRGLADDPFNDLEDWLN